MSLKQKTSALTIHDLVIIVLMHDHVKITGEVLAEERGRLEYFARHGVERIGTDDFHASILMRKWNKCKRFEIISQKFSQNLLFVKYRDIHFSKSLDRR